MIKTIARQLIYGLSVAGGCFLLMSNTHYGQISAQESLRAVGSMETTVYLTILNGAIQRFTIMGSILVSAGVMGLLSEAILGAFLQKKEPLGERPEKRDAKNLGKAVTEKEGNPWKNIPLEDYEGHMSHENVGQLQALNQIVKSQVEAYKPRQLVILGVSGGNGLEHINMEITKSVYAYDVNEHYLDQCRERFQHMGEVLILSNEDLTFKNTSLPASHLVIANLVVEYTGVAAFVDLLNRSDLKAGTVVSCVIQNKGSQSFVSPSSVTSLNALEDYHQEVDEKTLSLAMGDIRYGLIKREVQSLSGDKQFIRLDYCKN